MALRLICQLALVALLLAVVWVDDVLARTLVT
jgi:hypothetical protein